MDTARIDEIFNGTTDLRSIYDNLSEEELNGISFEDFEKLVNEASVDGDDEELNDAQMESVAGGYALVDDFIKWVAKKAREKIDEIKKGL